MNYRHIYHAGNFADVFKHAVLTLLLEYLRKKDAPFFVLDTHAGIGLYDLESEAARKTAEADAGIVRLWQEPHPPALLLDYLNIVRQANKKKGFLRSYPGSPLFIRAALRAQDRFTACELHPQDSLSLERALKGDRRIHVACRDGYEAVRALLPPRERRGLVLVDPPFEEDGEFGRMTRALAEGHRRFATGTFVFWHPIKNLAPIDAFYNDIRNLKIKDIVAACFFLRPPDDPDKLNGCGLVIVNPPWTLEENLGKLLPDLVGLMARDGGFARFERLAEE